MSNITLYKCGSFPVPSGTLDFDVSGLLLPFDPAVVIATVRAPSAQDARIQAFVSGQPTRDSFHVLLSAPTSVEGYKIDWAAWADSVTPVRGDSLCVGYDDLFRKVKRYLGYGSSADEVTEAEREEIDDAVQAGVRQFYYPPAVQGVDAAHEWSFLRGEARVVIQPGESSVMLPDGFGRICGSVRIIGQVNSALLPVVPLDFILPRITGNPDAGVPRVCAVRATGAFGVCGQLSELLVWPMPETACELSFDQESDTGRLDPDTRPFPLGGARYSELITESCLAVAEQRSNDEASLHTRLFRELLASAVEQDRKSSAAVYGPMSQDHFRNLSGSPTMRGW